MIAASARLRAGTRRSSMPGIQRRSGARQGTHPREAPTMKYAVCEAPLAGDTVDAIFIAPPLPFKDQPSASITASALVTTETFGNAKLIEALCHSAFIVEQQSSGTTTK